MRSPRTALLETPIASGGVILSGLYSLWMGVVLLNKGDTFGFDKQRTFQAPLSVFSFTTWGWLFVISGSLILTRLFMDVDRPTSILLHILAMIVSLAWAVSFDLGPLAVSQPAFTFIAALIFLLPYVPRIIEHRYGGPPPPLNRR